MVNTAHRLATFVALPAFVFLGGALAPANSVAWAQTSSAVSSSAATSMPETRRPLSPAGVYKGPPPIVMFVGKAPPPFNPMIASRDEPAIEFIEPPQQTEWVAPPEPERSPAPAPVSTPQRPYSITNQAQRDAVVSGWDPANTDHVAAPPMVSGGRPDKVLVSKKPGLVGQAQAQISRRYRSPVVRIVRDTGRAIVRDVPQAVADALPWVDRDAKNEPFKDVLGRVADDLHRAASHDPSWAVPAQREIRALSRQLDLLPAPPPLDQDGGDSRPASSGVGVDTRPFRPRPIWPGAVGRVEAQVRPVTLVTTSGQQDGPRVAGVAARYTPAAEDDDGNSVIPVVAKQRAGHGRPAARRP